MGNLAGKTLFITGASRGIGKAIAMRAAADGANIVVVAKTKEPHPKLPGTIYSAVEEIQAAIRSCGLAPRKARAISELSRLLVENHEGEVPDSLAALEALPGVGHKTASVVISQAFGVPAFPVDTHIHRLAQRWKLASGKNVADTEQSLKKLFPEESWNQVHLRIIFYGRQHCTARGCDGMICEICRTLFHGRKSPVRTKKA